jgi:hypothetical protein
MLFDIPETPKLKNIKIHGRLSFENDTDLHLMAEQIFVRTGELIIGSKENPFSKNAKITLLGDRNQKNMIYDNNVEAGNKIIANLGTISLIGAKRGWKMTRLLTEAKKGDKKI